MTTFQLERKLLRSGWRIVSYIECPEDIDAIRALMYSAVAGEANARLTRCTERTEHAPTCHWAGNHVQPGPLA